MINTRLGWLGQRQQVLAENVANSETPGFQPNDLEPLEFRSMLEGQQTQSTGLRTTHPIHFGGSGAVGSFDLVPQKDPKAVDATGNSVLLEDELMKVTKTAMDYQLITNLYRKSVGMVRTALGRPSGE